MPAGIKRMEGIHVMRVMRDVYYDVYYTVKSVTSVVSGFTRLTACCPENGWVEVSPEALYEAPYYTCAEYATGRHIPLPLVLGSPGEYPLQALALRIMRRMGLMRKAILACREYQSAYEAAWSVQ